MRWGLLGVRATIVLVNLAIVAIVLLSVLPLVSGGLRVDLPDNDRARPTYEGGVVRFSVPLDVYNGGYFDIKDFRVRFQVSDGGAVIADHTSPPADIVTGRTNHVDILMEVDLDEVPEEELRKLVFERTTLDLVVGVEASYSLGLVKASVHTNQSMEWEPLISDFAVDTNGISLQPNGTNVDILVPYSFGASGMVTGNTLGLAATVRNSTALLGTASQTIVLQEHNSGQVRFTVGQQAAMWLMSHPEDLTIGTDLTFRDVSFHQDLSYHWEGMA